MQLTDRRIFSQIKQIWQSPQANRQPLVLSLLHAMLCAVLNFQGKTWIWSTMVIISMRSISYPQFLSNRTWWQFPQAETLANFVSFPRHDLCCNYFSMWEKTGSTSVFILTCWTNNRNFYQIKKYGNHPKLLDTGSLYLLTYPSHTTLCAVLNFEVMRKKQSTIVFLSTRSIWSNWLIAVISVGSNNMAIPQS